MAAPARIRRGRWLLLLAGTAFVVTLTGGPAHADRYAVDSDPGAPGLQNVVVLATLPGGTVETRATLVVDWNGKSHVPPGSTITLAVDPGATTLPAGYAVSPVTVTIPAGWGSGNQVSGESAISFRAPGAGLYQYAVKWSPTASSSGPGCPFGPPCLTGGPAFVIELTVAKAVTATTTVVRDTSGADVTGRSMLYGAAVHDAATVSGEVNGVPITGSVTYRLFDSSDCTGPSVDETVPVGDPSTPRTPTVGPHSYSAEYGGDANYEPSSGGCEPFTTTLDLEALTVARAQELMGSGALTSVRLTHLYLDRIAALNTHGSGLNAVRALNPVALDEAAAADQARADGLDLGPLMGIPVVIKDNIDLAGVPTTAGAVALEHSLPPEDSTVAANLHAGGAVVLGKTNLSEFANFITNSNPSGYSGLGGQVLNAVDADLNPSGSSSGSATSAAAALATVTIGTETSGSIVSPSAQQGVVGLRPTVGLVSRYGIVPIAASQDTAGPITRTVADAAALLQAIAGPDPKDHSPTLWGPGVNDALIVPPQPSPLPSYLAALDPSALAGKRIGIVNSSDANYQAALTVVRSLGATTVTISTPSGGNTGQILNYEFKRDLNNYLGHLGPAAPIHTLADVIAFNNANAQEAIKYGQTILTASQALNVDNPSSSDSVTYRTNLVNGKNANRAAIDNALTNNSIEAIMTPSGTLTGVGARAGYPQITVPAGYATATRRPVNISFNGTAYSEAKLLGFAYAYEQASQLRRPASVIDPSLYRCARTDPASPYASRGGCAPGSELLDLVGTPPSLGFSLETASAADLAARLDAGTLTSLDLTKAYLARIAETNTSGPSIDAVRSVNPLALDEASASDARRAAGEARGPLEGLPVLVNDDVDVSGLPTTAGSVALQHSVPVGDSSLVARLRAAGAVILGKTNTTELSGWLGTSVPAGYSSLGGQVLNPSDADSGPGGSSAGAAAAAASGLAAVTIGTEASAVTNSVASIIAPSQANGVVGLRPTVGLVSRAGILTISETQETAGPIARTVRDAAAALQAIAGPDPVDPATSGQPATLPDYLAALSPTALAGKQIVVVSSGDANYNAAVAAVRAAGATTVTKTIPTPSPNPADIVGRELKRDVEAYLGALPAGAPVRTLQEILDYDLANAGEALKYGQGTLTTSNAVDLGNPTTLASYTNDRTNGLASNRAVVNNLLSGGFDAVLVPASTTLTGIADRAGYPQITVPAGYNLGSSKTYNPINVSFVGTAWSEATLLADAYAYEQATSLRQPPSFTNPSLWRCVTGSVFPPHSCAP